jgi:hypothetical protein
MPYYKIYSRSGDDFGIHSGYDRAEALAAAHRSAGYNVSYCAGELIFPDEETRKMCGDMDDWIFERPPTEFTDEQIARDWDLWQALVDQGTEQSKAEFEAMGIEQRLELMNKYYKPYSE